MTTNGREQEERRVEQALAELEGHQQPPDEGELRALARLASAGPRTPLLSDRRRARWTHPLRWVGAAAAVALLAGSGLGFGLGSSFTSSESARASAVGTGFLPARGWTVVQTGTVASTGASRAIAANVPLDPGDEPDDFPQRTLEKLPERGVVIVASFTPRGDAGADLAFPVRSLPLQVSDAEQHPGGYRLRAGIKGTNVEARIFFGGSRPSAKAIAAAQRQLSRLSVASERVTMFARPTVVGGGFNNFTVNLYGSVESRKAGESVAIQAKDCGTSFFRLVTGATTKAGGSWTWAYIPRITTKLRAVWDGSASPEIRIGRRASIKIEKDGFRRYEVSAAGLRSPFWRKKVIIQWRDPRLGSWTNLRTVVLTHPGSYGASSATFRLSLPRGTLVRAVLPLSQTRPCYLPGISTSLRT